MGLKHWAMAPPAPTLEKSSSHDDTATLLDRVLSGPQLAAFGMIGMFCEFFDMSTADLMR